MTPDLLALAGAIAIVFAARFRRRLGVQPKGFLIVQVLATLWSGSLVLGLRQVAPFFAVAAILITIVLLAVEVRYWALRGRW